MEKFSLLLDDTLPSSLRLLLLSFSLPFLLSIHMKTAGLRCAALAAAFPCLSRGSVIICISFSIGFASKFGLRDGGDEMGTDREDKDAPSPDG